MKKNELFDLGLQTLKSKNIVKHNEFRFISTEFGFVTSFSKMETSLFKIDQPYRMQEGRIALAVKGSAKVLINLIEYTFKANDISLIAPGSIIQITDVSPDFDAQMMAIDPQFLPTIATDEFFRRFLQHENNVFLTLTTDERNEIEYFMNGIWNVLQESVFRKEVVQHLLSALLYDLKYLINKRGIQESNPLSRQNEIFHRFLTLVNIYSKTERTVGFYADKLCLTPRYLNTVVKQASQLTIMNWINRSVMLEAKVLLKHSDKLVYQISDELNFPNPSFFCKFFKRMSGITPQEYQKM